MDSRVEVLAKLIVDIAQNDWEKNSNTRYWFPIRHYANKILDVLADYRADHPELYDSREAAMALVESCPLPPNAITYEKGTEILNKLQALAVQRAGLYSKGEKA